MQPFPWYHRESISLHVWQGKYRFLLLRKPGLLAICLGDEACCPQLEYVQEFLNR